MFQETLKTRPRILNYIPSLDNSQVCLYFAERLETESVSETTPKKPVKFASIKKLDARPKSRLFYEIYELVYKYDKAILMVR